MHRGLRMTKVHWAGIAVLGVCLFSGSCSDAPTNPRPCTLIGCFGGLELDLLGTLPSEYRVAFEVEGSPTFFFDCTGDSPCASPIFIREFYPETVRVTVSAGDITHLRPAD